MNKLNTIQKSLFEVSDAIQDVELISVDIKAGITEKSLSSLTAQIAMIDGAVKNIRISISEFQYSVISMSNATVNLKSNLSRWIDLASLIFSTVCLWLILAQLCLYIHSRGSKQIQPI